VIKLTVNGKDEETERRSILEYLNSKNVIPEKVVIELNGKIIKRNDLGNIMLDENDVLEVIRFVGGG
jgi:sulfur carrier protein